MTADARLLEEFKRRRKRFSWVTRGTGFAVGILIWGWTLRAGLDALLPNGESLWLWAAAGLFLSFAVSLWLLSRVLQVLLWKCPACLRPLPSTNPRFCPRCGVQLQEAGRG